MSVQLPPFDDSRIHPERREEQTTKREVAEPAEKGETRPWESQRSAEQIPRSRTYTQVTLEERANSSRHYYEDTPQLTSSSSSSSSSKNQEHFASPAKYIHIWRNQSTGLEYEYHSPTSSPMAVLDRQIAATKQCLNQLLDDKNQFLQEIEDTVDSRLKMRSERERRSEILQRGANDLRGHARSKILQTGANGLRKMRERFEARKKPEEESGCHGGCQSESEPVRQPRTKTWSTWMDELEGPFTSPDGREYVLAKDKDPRSRTMWRLFTDELEPYTSADGREYVVLVYTG